MSEPGFVDLYEILQISQQADSETIERVYRLLAKRYHPDNRRSGDEGKFRDVHAAYEVLIDPERRARFDVQYDRHRSLQWQVFQQDTALGSHEDDARIINGVLTLLYAARRRDPDRGGVGTLQLERTLGVPREHLEFPLWVLKKRGWIEVLDTGQPAITIDGIDQVIGDGFGPKDERLLAKPDPGSDAKDPGDED